MTHFVSQVVLEQSQTRPDKIAARSHGCSLTYGELSKLVRRMGGVVTSCGVKPGHRVLLALPDSFSFLAGFLGSILIGAVAVPMHSRLPESDFREAIAATNPALVIAPPGHCALNVTQAAGTPTLVLDDDTLDELTRNAPSAVAAPTLGEDVCLLLVTSGTTGHPKIVPHTHDHFLAVARHIGDFMDLRQDDVVLCSAKMSHAYGLFFSLLLPLQAGTTVLLSPDKPTAANTLQLLTEERVTVFGSVPALYSLLLLSFPENISFENLRACVSAGEALPAAVHKAWQETTGCEVWQGYGSTETMTFVIGSRPPDIAPGTAGNVIFPYEAVVLDAEGRLVLDGTPGHLAVKGPSVMTGYYNDSQWTSSAFTVDGMLLTGDMALRQGDTFTILGRMDDMFKAGGLWVSPTRVENALLSHKAVAQCAVTGGVAGPFTLVRAHVVTKQGAAQGKTLELDLKRHAARLLPEFMVPADIVFHSTLPMTPSGKIQRYKLRQSA